MHIVESICCNTSSDLNVCLDPIVMPFVAMLEYEDEPVFIFWSFGDQRNWQGTNVGNWSLVGTRRDSATLGSGDDIALLRAVAVTGHPFLMSAFLCVYLSLHR